MNRCLLALVFLLAAGTGLRAQTTDSYRDNLKKLLEVNNSLSANQIREALQQGTMEAVKESGRAKKAGASEAELEKKVASLVDTYLSNQFQEDLVDLVLPYYRANLTEEQLAKAVAMMSTERARTSTAHVNASMEQGLVEVTNYFTQLAQEVFSGKEAKPLVAKPCPESYRKLFVQYYEATRSHQQLEQMWQPVLQMLEQQMEGNPEGKRMMKAFVDNMMENLPVLMRNLYIGTVTEEDLAFQIELAATPEYRAIMKCASAMMSDIMKVAQGLFQKFGAWVQTQE